MTWCDGCDEEVESTTTCDICGQGEYCYANNDCLHDHYMFHCDEGEHHDPWQRPGLCSICYEKVKAVYNNQGEIIKWQE